MSTSDRKAVVALTTLYHLAQHYSGIEAKEYMAYITEVLNAYVQQRVVTQKEMEQMRRSIHLIDEKIAALNYDSTITLTLAIGFMLAEEFMRYCRNPLKLEKWQQLAEYCNSHELIDHTRKAHLYTELEKSDVVSNILLAA